MPLPSIGMLWIGGSLSWLEQLCIQSFLDNGHEVVLFSYDEVQNVPAGVRLENASDILATDKIIRHAKTGSPAYHADLFRLFMLRDTDLIWADTDAYCHQPWDVKPGTHFHGWISDDKPLVNNGVLGLPKDSKTLAAMLDFTSDEYPIPPWFKRWKREELQALKDKGTPTHVSELPWGVWGPNAVSHFLKETGEIAHSFPGHVLYPVPFKRARSVFSQRRRDYAHSLVTPETLSVHFWGRRFRNIAASFNGVPESGTYISELLQKHRIDPKSTAHLMKRRDPPKDELPALDFALLDDGDVANIILQRPDIIPSKPELDEWLKGDDVAVLNFARENRDSVLSAITNIALRDFKIIHANLGNNVPKKIGELGCGIGILAFLLFRKFNCDICLVDSKPRKQDRRAGFGTSVVGFAELEKTRLFLEANEVPSEKISILDAASENISDLGEVDLLVSTASCGYSYPVSAYREIFLNNLRASGCIVLDILRGSGGVRALKEFGEVTVLAKYKSHAIVMSRKGNTK